MLRRHGPILRTACAASLAFVVLASLRFDELRLSGTPVLAAWFLAGILYTNLFEYWVHRYPMHRGLPLLRHVRRNHIEHHRIFHGGNFRTTNPSDLAHISGRFWIFPLLLAGHYLLLTAVVPLDAALAFLSASYLHYLAFEISHWLTHLEDNAVDRILSGIPFVAAVRAFQIEHHRIHHQTPIAAFNFNPPYLGDALVGTPARNFGEPGRPVSGAAPVRARRRLPARPAVLYGTALILGAVALGIAAFAHVRPAPGTPAPRARS
jgi:hypothetical protein